MNARQHLEQLYADRLQWVETSRKNGFEEGIRDLLAEIYPDQAHFIYELLQNAEDARATGVTFDLNRTRLEITHDGHPFSPKDVESITSIGQSSKKDDVNQIGKFGVGFKAVFGYTSMPQIQSGDYRFEIRDLVCPVRLGDGVPDDTTQFIFPFNHPEKDPEQAYSETAEGLKKLSDETLLFLNHIRAISWFVEEDATSGDIKRESATENRIRIVRNSTDRAAPEISEWLRFQTSIDETGRFDEQGKLKVAIAFRLGEREAAGSEGEPGASTTQKKQIVEADGKLFIFFPAEKETTKLRFHIHGPYASAVDRASIKSGRPENQALLARTADLVVAALPTIRDMGLLTADFLSVLPNPEDQLSPFYEPIRKQIVATMRRDELVPKHGGGHAPAIWLLRGPRRIREVIDAERIGFFAAEPGESTNRIRGWAAGVMQHQREDRFLQSLGIAAWGWKELGSAIRGRFGADAHLGAQKSQAWLARQDDVWMQELYALLEEAPKEVLRMVKDAAVVRLESGTHVVGSTAYFPDGDHAHRVDGLVRVKTAILRGENAVRIERVRRFLAEVGVNGG
ncbi:MAG: ATP-binding protein [Gemmatimonadetes bacterium]|nr:ATP-binding protein [Gemmatimonadota bacterium]